MNNFFLGIILLIFGGFSSFVLKNEYKVKFVSFVNLISAFFCLAPALDVLLKGQNISQTFNFNEVFGAVSFSIDPLSAFFIFLISFMSLFSVFYANGYLKPYFENKNISAHLMFLQILITSMLLVVTVQNALMFLVVWELMSLSSFFLVIFENEKKEVLKAGIKYLVFMHISVLFIIFAFALLVIKSGSLNFSDFSNVLQNNHNFSNLVFALAFIGFGTKAGFVPFHNWLSDAHPAAPSHVSAIMSGIMIKTGIFGILKMIFLIGAPSISLSYFVLIISLLTALYGVLYAIFQDDIKKLLAYSSIENIGIIGLGVSVGMLGLSYSNSVLTFLGFTGAILHILNHSVFKQLLFLGAGSVYLKTHTRNLELLGGLIKSMPKTAMLFLTGSLAISALPPFNGFISEFLIYFGILKGLLVNNFFIFVAMIFAFSGLAFVGSMAIICFSKAFSTIFLGNPRSDYSKNVTQDVSASMILSMIILFVISLLIGLFPQYILKIIQKPVIYLTNSQIDFNLIPFEILSQISFVMCVFFGFVLGFIGLKFIFTKNKIQTSSTWGCGYNKPNERMQYSASSYVRPFLSMLKPLFKNVFDVEKPHKLFPKSAHFRFHVEDIEEEYVIHPLVKFDEWFLTKFEKMQNGNIQTYIKYGLIFLVILLIGYLILG